MRKGAEIANPTPLAAAIAAAELSPGVQAEGVVAGRHVQTSWESIPGQSFAMLSIRSTLPWRLALASWLRRFDGGSIVMRGADHGTALLARGDRSALMANRLTNEGSTPRRCHVGWLQLIVAATSKIGDLFATIGEVV